MTLPEVLVAMTVTGLVAASLAMASSVLLRQTDNTQGRSNNARSEQNVGVYMPGDLASAEQVDTLPGAVPCGPSPACPSTADVSGSNALMLTWTGQEFDTATNSVISTISRVSYRVTVVSGEYRMLRVECSGPVGATPTCETRTVLRNLEPPPAGTTFVPGETAPAWVVSVSQAAAPDDTSSSTGTVVVDPGFQNKNAQRVVVTINGGGDGSGVGAGGQNQISLSAGGTNRNIDLSTDDLTGAPTFTAARSRCGGNFGMVVDKSGSIGGDMPTVRSGISSFIDTFAGTPVKLQVVTFSSQSDTLGAGSGWTKYYDMLIDQDVTDLKNLVGGMTAGGGTNWEDGFFRMLKNSDGTVQAQLPNNILFFTDGIPTFSRIDYTSATAPVVTDPADAGLTPSNGSDFSQLAWNRTERLIRDRGAINLIGVYVNSNVDASSTWATRVGFHIDYTRASNLQYQSGSTGYQRSNNLLFQISTDSDLKYQRWNGWNWQYTDRNNFLAYNSSPGYGDGWHVFANGSISNSDANWLTITEAQYNAANTGTTSGDGFRTKVGGGSATPWVSVTASQYNLSNTTGDETDGWRTTGTGWTDVAQSTYAASNSVPGESDGWRTFLSGGASSWVVTTQAEYDASNTTSDGTDGWLATKVYSEPYTFYEGTGNATIKNYATIGNLVVGNTSGIEGNFVEALPRGGPYTNAAAADLFVLPNYSNFGSALASVALGQCGGTVTLQTKVGSSSALDPFTYENTATHETVKTSAAYRSGTFDVALPGGSSTVINIAPQDFSNLTHYQPAGWTCKSAGVAYPFTVVPVAGHAPWTGIQLTVSPNKAVSCIQQVTLS
jgi:hypothetical protein